MEALERSERGVRREAQLSALQSEICCRHVAYNLLCYLASDGAMKIKRYKMNSVNK